MPHFYSYWNRFDNAEVYLNLQSKISQCGHRWHRLGSDAYLEDCRIWQGRKSRKREPRTPAERESTEGAPCPRRRSGCAKFRRQHCAEECLERTAPTRRTGAGGEPTTGMVEPKECRYGSQQFNIMVLQVSPSVSISSFAVAVKSNLQHCPCSSYALYYFSIFRESFVSQFPISDMRSKDILGQIQFAVS